MSEQASSEAETAAPSTTEEATQEVETTDLVAEVEKWKAQSRKNEDRAKANAQAARELAELRKQNETEVDTARREGYELAMSEVAGDRVRDAFTAAAAGRGIDVGDLLEGVDASKFVTEDHKPDRDRIAEWVNKVVPEAPQEQTPFPDGAPGYRGGGGPALNDEDGLIALISGAVGVTQ